jgi:hypothetical protein
MEVVTSAEEFANVPQAFCRRAAREQTRNSATEHGAWANEKPCPEGVAACSRGMSGAIPPVSVSLYGLLRRRCDDSRPADRRIRFQIVSGLQSMSWAFGKVANLVSSFSAVVSPSEKYRVAKLTGGIASLIPRLQPEVPSEQILPASSGPIFRRGPLRSPQPP